MPRGKYNRDRFKKPKPAPPEVSLSVTTLPPTETNGRPRKYQCLACGHVEFASHPKPCPECFNTWKAKNFPLLSEVAPLPPPPGPPPEKPALPGQKRYAKVYHEPINPRFKLIRFEDGTEDKLWVRTDSGSLRHQQLVVEPNRDHAQGGYTLVREEPRHL